MSQRRREVVRIHDPVVGRLAAEHGHGVRRVARERHDTPVVVPGQARPVLQENLPRRRALLRLVQEVHGVAEGRVEVGRSALHLCCAPGVGVWRDGVLGSLDRPGEDELDLVVFVGCPRRAIGGGRVEHGHPEEVVRVRVAALEEQRVNVSEGLDLLRRHVHSGAEELHIERLVVVRLRRDELSRPRVGALRSDKYAALHLGSIVKNRRHSISINADILQLLAPVDMSADPGVLEQRIAEPRTRDALAVVGRYAELGLEVRDVEEEEVARVVAGDLRVDLGVLDEGEGLGRQEVSQEREAPVEGDGPALIASVGHGVALEDFEGDIGLEVV